MELVTVNNSKDITKGLINTVVIAGNGTFEIQDSWLGTSTKKVSSYGLSVFPELEEKIDYKDSFEKEIVPKEALYAVLSWYDYMNTNFHTEAQVVFYCSDKEYIIIDGVEKDIKDIPSVHYWSDTIFSYTPVQINSGSLTTVCESDEYYNAFNNQLGTFLETHSHNSMAAFRSSTDEAYSYSDGLQLVFGKFNTNEIMMFAWCSCRGLQDSKLTTEIIEKFVDVSEFNENWYLNKDIINEYNFDDLIEEWTKQSTQRTHSHIKTNVSNWFTDYEYIEPEEYVEEPLFDESILLDDPDDNSFFDTDVINTGQINLDIEKPKNKLVQLLNRIFH